MVAFGRPRQGGSRTAWSTKQIPGQAPNLQKNFISKTPPQGKKKEKENFLEPINIVNLISRSNISDRTLLRFNIKVFNIKYNIKYILVA